MGLATAMLDKAPEESVAARVRSAVETVFDAVAATRADTTALLERVAAEGRRPATVDLAALRPGLHLRLARHALVSGVGFVAAPGLLADVPAWLEWWQSGSEGDVRPLLLDWTPSTRRTPTTRTGTGSRSPATRGNVRWPGRMSTTSAPTSTA